MTWLLAELISSELGISAASQQQPASALWRYLGLACGRICIASHCVSIWFYPIGEASLVWDCHTTVPIDLKLAVQPHILKGTCTKPHRPIDCQFSTAASIWLDCVILCVLSITFAWLLCARRESPLRWSDEIQSIESTLRW